MQSVSRSFQYFLRSFQAWFRSLPWEPASIIAIARKDRNAPEAAVTAKDAKSDSYRSADLG